MDGYGFGEKRQGSIDLHPPIQPSPNATNYTELAFQDYCIFSIC